MTWIACETIKTIGAQGNNPSEVHSLHSFLLICPPCYPYIINIPAVRRTARTKKV